MKSNKSKSRDDVSPAIPSNVDQMVLLGDARLDAIMTTVVALGSELWTTKRRVKVLERVLSDGGIGTAEVEAYQPTPAETAQWNAERDRFIAAIYGHLANQPRADQPPTK